jgi:hypothetical protein
LTRQESVVRYERLRDGQQRGGRPSRERELFMRCGMLGWLNAWACYTPLPKPIGHGAKPRPEAAAVGLDLPLNGALAEVLATMTWAAFT